MEVTGGIHVNSVTRIVFFLYKGDPLFKRNVAIYCTGEQTLFLAWAPEVLNPVDQLECILAK